MSTAQRQARVVPAQLSFLAIYNPSLGGDTDESFRDQLVFYYSRAAQEARLASRKYARNEAAGGDALHAEENEKLRQIGLAQGMVDFARTFSNGEPVDSIETEKSRIVLHELEKGWWILASIDLTRLPSIAHSSSAQTKPSLEKATNELTVEYSAREVSPPALLIQQLLQAHYVFGLHHGPSLTELFLRLSREKFCGTLDRFWTRFARTWEVLLHGNPAADVFSGVELASGGELGFGVGEEEWGSGEREVLEGLAHRTEGLVDLIVARFGEAASAEETRTSALSDESLPWLGGGIAPTASDGMIFGGIGAIQRHSLRSISLWMRQIYTYGDQAYGVKDNPMRERRKRRRPHPQESTTPVPDDLDQTEEASKPPGRSQIARKSSKESNTISAKLVDTQSTKPGISSAYDATTTKPSGETNKPNIPPPIITASEQALDKATKQVEQGSNSENDNKDENSNMLGISDTYMKYLTFGLSTLGKQKQPSTARRASNTGSEISQTQANNGSAKPSWWNFASTEQDESPAMAHIDPIPDGETLKAKLAIRKRQENRGHFVIGLKGDLLELDEISEDDRNALSAGSGDDDGDGSRIILRTVQVETIPTRRDSDDDSQASQRQGKADSMNSQTKNYRRLRVLVYVHRPFMYCFLFDNHASSLQLTRFYKSLHRNLVPIHKPLLSSTSPRNVAQRISTSQAPLTTTPSDALSATGTVDSNKTATTKAGGAVNTSPIYALIYHPKRMTLHTSIPNIPEPGTPAAEGIFTSAKDDTGSSAWTRVEALNVHSQILNTLTSVKGNGGELERTSKTSRGWWVVWMKVATSASHESQVEEGGTKGEEASSLQAARSEAASSAAVGDERTRFEDGGEEGEEDGHRIAFLVRKATDAATSTAKPVSSGSRAVSSMLEVMSLGMAGREDDNTTGGVSAGWGPAALAGGIGIDARKYVEGLLSLNR